MSTKMCVECKQQQEVSNFYKNKSTRDGLANKCKSCAAKYDAKYRMQNSVRLSKANAKWREQNATEHKNLMKRWRDSHRDELVEYRRKNRDAIQQAMAQWRILNQDHIQAYAARYYLLHRDEILERCRVDRIINSYKYVARRMKRRADLKQATPKWADLKAIEQVYYECVQLTNTTGVAHEVDHYYPINGELVCGLHVPNNLQILLAVDNNKKRNYHPDLL